MSTKSTEQAGMELLTLASKYGLSKICYVQKKNIVAVANVFCQSKMSHCQLHYFHTYMVTTLPVLQNANLL